MAGFSTEAKVGVFVLVALALLTYMTLRLGKFQFGEPEGYRVWGVFDTATGLKKNAPVEMAGIQIGTVDRIELDQGQARITLRIHPDVKLAADSAAYIRTRGVLGDKYVAVEAGSPAAPPLQNGEQITKARVPTDLDQVMARVGNIADDLKDITSSLKVSIASPQSQQNISESLHNLKDLTATLKVVVADNQERLSRVVENLDRFTGDMSQITGQNKQALNETIQNFQVVSAQLSRTIVGLTSVVEKIDKGQGSIGALVNERKTVEDLNSTLASLKQISQKIDQGKGSIGKLVNDDTTVTKIDEALTGINDYLTRGDAWRVYVDYRGEYLFGESSLRSTLNLRLQPKADKFYLIGIVDDPVGKRSEKTTTTTVHENGTSYQRTVKQTTVDRDELKWNAQIGKRFYDVTARAGLLASRGGFGLDYHMLNDRLKLTFEAYDFRTDANPHLKVAADYSFWKYFYVTTGMDDFISQDDQATFFLGGGVTFFDDDLKFLLTSAPVP
ncbi:MAG: MlaD family protein [Pseudomonadota bacterium]